MAKKPLPAGQLMIDLVLGKWPLWGSCKPTLLRQLKGGSTNSSFLIQVKNKQWVLRINAENSADLNLNRELEHKILSLPGINHLSPNIIYCDPEKKFLITEYVPGKGWDSKETDTEKNIINLALLLKSIHQLGPVDGILDYRKKAASYWHNINNENPITKIIQSLQKKLAWHFNQASLKCTETLLCHNDLLPNNLITGNDGRLYAIDWEYAAMGDPYFDLAAIVEGHGLDKHKSELLLKTYLSKSTIETLVNAEQRLFHSRVIYCYLTLLWYVIQNKTHGNMDDLCKEKTNALNSMLSNKT